jgi:hypothetical protein
MSLWGAVSCGVVGLVVESRRRVQTVAVRTALLAIIAATTTISAYLDEGAGAAAERERRERKAAATIEGAFSGPGFATAGVLASTASDCLTFC